MLTKATCGVDENTYPASSMGKTKNFLLICTTIDLSMLGTTAGISLVMSPHKLWECGNHKVVPNAERKKEGCEGCWYSEDVGAQSKEKGYT